MRAKRWWGRVGIGCVGSLVVFALGCGKPSPTTPSLAKAPEPSSAERDTQAPQAPGAMIEDARVDPSSAERDTQVPQEGNDGAAVSASDVRPHEPDGPRVAGPEPAARCAAFVKAIEPDLFVPLAPNAKLACAAVLSLEAPRAVALVVPDLPSPEGEWTAARVVVASGDRWYATPLVGSLELKVTRLEAGPGERHFHFVTWWRGLELGAGTVESETLHLCRVPSEGAPRCASRQVGGKFQPLPANPEEDWPSPGEAEDWTVPWKLTPDGVRFEAVTGKISAETERPAPGLVTLDDLMASGVDLEPE